jgi:hypothetical protein
MSLIKAPKIKRARGPVVYPVNMDEFFERKANEARAFLEKHPVPEHLFKKK